MLHILHVVSIVPHAPPSPDGNVGAMHVHLRTVTFILTCRLLACPKFSLKLDLMQCSSTCHHVDGSVHLGPSSSAPPLHPHGPSIVISIYAGYAVPGILTVPVCVHIYMYKMANMAHVPFAYMARAIIVPCWSMTPLWSFNSQQASWQHHAVS